jgi:hypothetical protein
MAFRDASTDDCILRPDAMHHGHYTGHFDPGNDPNDIPPPAYSETYGHIEDDNNELGTNATVAGIVIT